MGIVIKQSAYSSIFSYAGAAIGAVNTIFLFPKFLEAEQIGLYNFIINAAILLVPFANLGMSQSIVKYFPRFKQTPKTKGHFLGFVTLFFIASFLIFTLLFQWFKPVILSFFISKAPEIAEHTGLILTVIFLYAASVIYESYSRALLKITIPFFVKELLLRILKAVWILLFAIGVIDFELMLLSIIFNYSLALLVVLIALIMQGQINFSFEVGWINKKFLMQFVNFSLFAMVGAGGSAILFEIDSMMVSGMLGLEENGIYTTVFFIAIMIELPRRAISQIASALVSHAFQQERLDEIKSVYQKVSINQLIIGSFLFCLIWANVDDILMLIPDDKYLAGKYVILIIGFGKLIDMTASINSEIIVMSRYFRFNLILLFIMGATALIGNLIFIPLYGINGAALATAITFVIYNVLKFTFIQYKFHFNPFTINTLKGIIPAIMAYLISLFIPDFGHPLLNILLVSAVLSIIFVLLTILLKPSAEIDRIYQQALAKMGLRK